MEYTPLSCSSSVHPSQESFFESGESEASQLEASQNCSEKEDEEIPPQNRECGSSDDDMESGQFFLQIEKDRSRAHHERRYLMEKLKSPQRVGSIFIDKIKRVIAAIQRESQVFDYLIEWEYSKKDRLKPTTSIVKGAHFVFVKPLYYRRYVESNHLLQGGRNEGTAEVQSYTGKPFVCLSPTKPIPRSSNNENSYSSALQR